MQSYVSMDFLLYKGMFFPNLVGSKFSKRCNEHIHGDKQQTEFLPAMIVGEQSWMQENPRLVYVLLHSYHQ